MMMKILTTQIVISISEVMETMFYLPVEHREHETIESSGLLETNNLKTCSITFSGHFSGTLYLLMQKSLLKIMAENFLGEKSDNLTKNHLSGTIKETLNMIAGNTFGKIDAIASFGLGIPKMLNKLEPDLLDAFIIIDTMEGRMAVGVELYPQQAA